MNPAIIDVLCPAITCLARPGQPCRDMGKPYHGYFHPQRRDNYRTHRRQVATFYDWSGGMESSAMLVIDRQRIADTNAIVRWIDTGKQFPEMYESKAQIEQILDVEIISVPRRITFEEYLFERGGMLRKGMNDCSRRMKRGNLARHMKTFERPYEVNVGYNADETDRAEKFIARNERPWLHWRYPLIEQTIYREDTWDICRKAGFTILIEMYEKMGRFDCYFCPNQKPKQALKVVEHYPALAAEWIEWERRKGHSFLPVPLTVLVASQRQDSLFQGEGGSSCSCLGGDVDYDDDDEDEERKPR